MSSLRLRLLFVFSGVVIISLCLSQYAVYVQIRNHLQHTFDQSLIEKARVLAVMIEQVDEIVDVDIHNHDLPEYSRLDDPEFYELWDENGAVLARSDQLQTVDLTRRLGPSNTPLLYDLTLPDGQPGRAVSHRFRPSEDCSAFQLLVHELFADNGLRQQRPKRIPGRAWVTLVVARNSRELDSSLATIAWILGGTVIVTVIVAIAALTWLLKRSLRPLTSLTGQIAAVNEQTLAHGIELEDAPEELQPIVDRLNGLMERLEDAFRRERTFSANIAHELRTPLAGIRSTLELSLSRERDGGSYRDSISTCLRIARQTESVITTLLTLCRSQSDDVAQDYEVFDVQDVVHLCWRHFAAICDEKQAVFRASSSEEMLVEADRGKLIIVLNNLMDNAARYVNPGGSIELQAQASNGQLSLRIANSGCDLKAADVERVFDCFWQADAARTQTGTHAGLGLALVRRLVESMDGSVTADVVDGQFIIHASVPIHHVDMSSEFLTDFDDGPVDSVPEGHEAAGVWS